MKDKIVTQLLKLIKVKSQLTFVAAGIFIYCVINDKLDPATTTAILMMVFQSLFQKKGDDSNGM